MKPDIKHYDIAMENYDHMVDRFEKLVSAHPMYAMFRRQLNLPRLKKEMVRKRKLTAFFLVKQFLLAEAVNPILFIEMKAHQHRLEHICRQSGFDYIWQPLFTELIKTFDYQRIAQYQDLLSMTGNQVLGTWLSRVRKAVGPEKYENICRQLSGITTHCESIKSLELFLEYTVESFGKITSISETTRILQSLVPGFCALSELDGDCKYLLDAWGLFNRQMKEKHRYVSRSISETILMSHIRFIKDLLKKGFSSNIIFSALSKSSHINLQNQLSLEDRRIIHLSSVLLNTFSREKQEAVQHKLESLNSRPIYHYFMRELIIPFCLV